MLSLPTLAAIDDVGVLAGAPLHVPLNGFDADNDPLSFSVGSTNSSLTTLIPEGNRSMRISVQNHGDMVLELFEQRAPRTTARIIELTDAGFYNGVTFHRIIEDFMIQGGDPNGDGTGGSGVEIEDEYHSDLLLTGKGITAMANRGPNTNDSQFFITAGPARYLDNKHPVFAFLTSGEDVRQSIAGVVTDADDSPEDPVVMTSVEIFTDVQNGALMLSAPKGTNGQADVTVTVDDGQGGTAQQTFHVTIADPPDEWAAADPIVTTVDTAASVTLPPLDIQGVDVVYEGFDWSDDLDVQVGASDGYTTVTPQNGLVGVQWTYMSATVLDGYAAYDQYVPVYIDPTAPTGVELLASTDTGSSDDDGITRRNNSPDNLLSFRVSGVLNWAEVTVLADGVEIGRATAAGDSVVVETDGGFVLSDGVHSVTARQALLDQEVEAGETVDLVSEPSPPIQITVDTVAPQFTSLPVTSAVEGEVYAYDVQTDDEDGALAVSYRLTTSPAGMLIDQSTGEITWTADFQQRLVEPVVVRASDPAGNEVSQSFDVVAGDLPQIEFLELPDQVAQDGYRYTFQVVRSGRLTIEMLFSHAEGDVDMTLFNAWGLQSAQSATQTDNERIDMLVTAGWAMELVIAGNNPHVTYRLTNLLVDRPGRLSVYGTDGDDTFEIIAGPSRRVTVNGVVYDQFNPVTGQTIEVDGLGGNDTGKVVGTTADELAVLSPGAAELAGPGYQVSLADVASITVDGCGGNDVARLQDSPGDDEFTANWKGGTLSGDGFNNRVNGFEEVYVDGSAGGFDTAKLYDSAGDDTYVATPTFAGLSGDGFRIEARYFQAAHAYAVAGGVDEAKLYDSAGDDTLYGSPGETTLYGEGFYNRAKQFDAVHSFATAGGIDKADLYDSPGDDVFSGGSVEGALYGVGFFNRAKFFEEMVAHADAGGTDTANLYDSPGDDTFVASPGYGGMSGDAFSVEARSFDEVSGSAYAGGTDLAKMYDSPGDDIFYGSSTGGRFSGAGLSSLAKYFDDVQAYGTAGGFNVAMLYDSPGDDTFAASPGTGTLSGDGFSVLVDAFHAIHAYATAGGTDKAELYDSAGDDVFHAVPEEGALFGDGYYNRAKFFEEVLALSSDEGNDVARLYDSPGNDNFNGGPTSSTMYSNLYVTENGNLYRNTAESFDDVRGYASAGDYDFTRLSDSPGDDFLVTTPGYATLSGDGYLVRAESFRGLAATATTGIDLAKMFDSPDDDTFRGTPTEGEFSSSSMFYTVKNFTFVHAYATAGGHDTAILFDSSGNDTLHSTPEASALYGPGFYNRAKFFEEVYAKASDGDDDRALLYDSESVDLLEAEDNWAQLSNAAIDFLCQAEAFDYVKATATTQGDKKDVPPLAELLFTLELEGPWQDV